MALTFDREPGKRRRRPQRSSADPVEVWREAAERALSTFGYLMVSRPEAIHRLGDTSLDDCPHRVAEVLAEEGCDLVLWEPRWPKQHQGVEEADQSWVALWAGTGSLDGLLVEVVEDHSTSTPTVRSVHLCINALVPTCLEAGTRKHPGSLTEPPGADRHLEIDQIDALFATIGERSLNRPPAVGAYRGGGPGHHLLALRHGQVDGRGCLRLRLAILRVTALLLLPWEQPALRILGGRGGYLYGSKIGHTTSQSLLAKAALSRFGPMVKPPSARQAWEPVGPPVTPARGGRLLTVTVHGPARLCPPSCLITALPHPALTILRANGLDPDGLFASGCTQPDTHLFNCPQCDATEEMTLSLHPNSDTVTGHCPNGHHFPTGVPVSEFLALQPLPGEPV